MTIGPDDVIRQKLLRRRDELRSRQGRVEHDFQHRSDPLVADAPDRAIQLQNDDVLREIGNAALGELSEIEAALARLEQGSYGICRQCQSKIDPRRLAAVPYAVTCLQCSG